MVYARFVKHRSLAAELIEGGNLRINSTRVTKISHAVKPGDVLTMAFHQNVMVVKVLGQAEMRGSAPNARQLYEDLSSEKMDA